MRLQKYLADCGIASRRKCEEIIASGRVSVNGNIITEMGHRVQDGDTVCIDGNHINGESKKHYYAFHKPVGVISASSDDRGRKTVLDYFEDVDERLFVVGRLDYDTEGLIFVTNDGDFANKVTHPKFESTKLYEAVCSGSIDDRDIYHLRTGINIDGRMTSKAEVKTISVKHDKTILHIQIHEGRNRQIRKMIEAVGARVIRLKRIQIGPVSLDNLAPGQYRRLKMDEINFFLNK